jgi:RNA polymerase sigma-70 factor (ECF subfamily)
MYGVASRHIRALLEHTARIEDEHEQPRMKEHEVFATALGYLEHLEREIIVLRVAVGLSATETAEALGLRPGAVRVLQHSALRALRRQLGL